ncbi:Nuclear pore complex protein GP210 [Vitis vinifera]|uniref:Nuclear pore complex protein GP210 n=1 Tax=Vitis vinifera TaxID=29760 RepID=A0A438EFN5_VITVI|nr:Nuclear pore complex protein GP210 [Vitis vinifera]
MVACIVRATVIGFAGTVSGHGICSAAESSENVLTDAVRLQLVSSLRVTPEFKLLFFNSDAKVPTLLVDLANLSITGGSCFLDAVVNDSRVVDVIQPPPGLQCLQLIVAPKGWVLHL